MRAFAIQAFLLLLGVSTARAQGAPAAKPAALQWGPAHAAFPKGTLCLRIADDLGDLFHDDQFAELFPTREIVPIYSGDFIWGLGAMHCMTQQQPA